MNTTTTTTTRPSDALVDYNADLLNLVPPHERTAVITRLVEKRLELNYKMNCHQQLLALNNAYLRAFLAEERRRRIAAEIRVAELEAQLGASSSSSSSSSQTQTAQTAHVQVQDLLN